MFCSMPVNYSVLPFVLSNKVLVYVQSFLCWVCIPGLKSDWNPQRKSQQRLTNILKFLARETDESAQRLKEEEERKSLFGETRLAIKTTVLQNMWLQLGQILFMSLLVSGAFRGELHCHTPEPRLQRQISNKMKFKVAFLEVFCIICCYMESFQRSHVVSYCWTWLSGSLLVCKIIYVEASTSR